MAIWPSSPITLELFGLSPFGRTVQCIICIMYYLYYFYIRAILYNVLFFKDYDINLNDVLVPHKPE